MNIYSPIPSPIYIIEEVLLRKNLQVLKDLALKANIEIILAFKAFAQWKLFPIFKEYINHTTASSPYEARLAYEEFGSKAHCYSPAYEKETFPDIIKYCNYITFNSLNQYETFKYDIELFEKKNKTKINCGLRINPECSDIETDIYNPCIAGTRFGLLDTQIPKNLPKGINGLHCHNHCECFSTSLEKTLIEIDRKFSKWLNQITWLNLGGGHLITHKEYNIKHLISIVHSFKNKYPHLKIILEPGSAFTWQTGALHSKVIDIVENKGIKTAILNISFTCHMPDCLEMPYIPKVRGAKIIIEKESIPHLYRLGGNSCLSGDFMGYWQFTKDLKIGDTVIFEDMLHYTIVKTNMFNGIQHPAIGILKKDGVVQVLKRFTYEDYKNRMD